MDIPHIAREVVNGIGYDHYSKGFDGHTCAVLTSIDEQSPDIAMGVDASLEEKSGEMCIRDRTETVTPQLPAAKPVVQEGEMRAVWISYYELDGRGKTADQFADMIGGMFDKIKGMGLNTVVVHVRANSDAFYPSSYFPWSEYAAGQQGQNPGYDPLNILIEAAHDRGLAFHAWLNPYRVSNKLSLIHI